MKNTIKLFGILAFTLVFGMMVFGCKDKPDDNNQGNNNNSGGTPGTFTLTNIPSEYNGKYGDFEADIGIDYVEIFGFQSLDVLTDTITYSRISNGGVSIPAWIVENENTVKRYNGNHTGRLWVTISDSNNFEFKDIRGWIDFESVTFTNGSATKSFNDGIFTANYVFDQTDYLLQGAWFDDTGDYLLYINAGTMVVKYMTEISPPYRTEFNYMTSERYWVIGDTLPTGWLNGSTAPSVGDIVANIVLFDYSTNDKFATLKIIRRLSDETLEITGIIWHDENYYNSSPIPKEGTYYPLSGE
jgi:hypothetical protein